MLRALLLVAFVTTFAIAQEQKSSAPKGELTKYTFNQSKAFPGTTRA